MVERKCERTGARRQVERVEKVSSSVATGGHRGARAPLPSTGMVTGFVQIRGDFFRGRGVRGD